MIRIAKKGQTDETLIELESIKPGSWIDLVNPTKKEIKSVIQKTGVLQEHITTALDEDERPRFDVEEDTLIIFRVPYEVKMDSGLCIKTMPIGIIINDQHITTVHLSKTEVLNDFFENKIKDFHTTKKTRFLIQIMSRANFYFSKYLDKVESEINKIEGKLMKSLKNEEVIRLFKLQKTLIYFSTAIMANGNVLENILKGRVVKLYKEDEDLLGDIITENKQCLEMTTIFNNILSNTLDAYASVVSNNLNVVMKLLTSLTIMLSIPTIVSSFYGMNVDLPFQRSPMAFMMTLLISLFLSTIIAIVFMKKKWL
ncbi:MAG: magnesium transporter CorA family protein [Candidatus Aenigmarchaeota archaeon]|nr:magnesium transporter CorA family protein [Candidatus Aenigmarchaeota archaeon]